MLAEIRLDEASTLLNAGKWAGAYYLAGYAVELGLKACIINTLLNRDAFPARNFSSQCYTHDVKVLIGAAGLADRLEASMDADATLRSNWSVTVDWSEEKRYHTIDEVEAREFFAAIIDADHGVMAWIKSYW